MNHIWYQSLGEWWGPDGKLWFKGYAGKGEGLNNPKWQWIPFKGPLPQGSYTIGPLEDLKNLRGFGPGYMHLWAHPGNEMKGRDGFLLHWDLHHDADKPSTKQASSGCIVPFDGSQIARVSKSGCSLLVVEKHPVPYTPYKDSL